MKKLLTILALTVISMTALFANTTKVQLKTDVPEVKASFVLKYNNNAITGETNEFVMDKKLSERGQTKDFIINVTSNYNNNQNVQVAITPGDFILQRNGASSNIKPTVNWIHKVETFIPAGVQNDFLISKFNLTWDGTSKAAELDAGTYVSDVQIVYTAN